LLEFVKIKLLKKSAKKTKDEGSNGTPASAKEAEKKVNGEATPGI
jgi:hypothetical protein